MPMLPLLKTGAFDLSKKIFASAFDIAFSDRFLIF